MLSKNFALLAASVVLITSSPSFASPVFFYRAGNGDISEHIDRITDQKSEIMLSIPTLNVGDSLSANASYRGDGGSVTWSVSGRLPDGVIFSPSGSFTGSPTESGTFRFTLNASAGGEVRASRSFSMTVVGGIDFKGEDFFVNVDAQGSTGNSYISGGTEPYEYNVIAGQLPPGYEIASAQNAFTFFGFGAPAGKYDFTVRVTDANGLSATADFSITIDALPELVAEMPDGFVGVPYSGSFTVKNVSDNYTAETVSNVPGLTWSGNTLSGVPTSTFFSYNNVPVSITIKDGIKEKTFTHKFNIFNPLKIVLPTDKDRSPSSDDFEIWSPDVPQLGHFGGGGSVIWEFVNPGNLPGDIKVSATGRFSKTLVAGTYTFTVKATDNRNELPIEGRTDTKDVTLHVYNVPNPDNIVDESGNFFNGNTKLKLGVPISSRLVSKGGKAPFTWSLGSGNLPEGLSFDPANSTISGTPTTAGTYNFSIIAVDALGYEMEKSYTNLQVQP